MLEKVKNILKQEKSEVPLQSVPNHVAITLGGINIWSEKVKVPLKEAYEKSGLIINEVISEQIKNKISITTFFILPEDFNKESESFPILTDSLIGYLKELNQNNILSENKIKVSIIGKWYDLPGRLVDEIKAIIDTTKDNDQFFVNFCINYGGQEEIVDACKLIARQVKAGKLDPDLIDKTTVKENIYSSYLIPPKLLIVNGPKLKTNGLLLWDSNNTQVHFSERLWPDFSKTDLIVALKHCQK
ncbi:MAG: polyprenyl diphosphate synthase [Candidatus Woesearchaeota archaeon]|jgi:undecaprenyl diphosphate synthase|nr:polyprenyl diphosphate synthase [Candidatus Woesearchaeota archaeon]